MKTKEDKRGLASVKVSIKQVTVCTNVVVSGISDNATHDASEPYFESRINSVGPVERPKIGRAVVVFQNPKGL